MILSTEVQSQLCPLGVCAFFLLLFFHNHDFSLFSDSPGHHSDMLPLLVVEDDCNESKKNKKNPKLFDN